MAKKNFSKGIDNVFSSTTNLQEVLTDSGTGGTIGTIGTQGDALVSYNIRYPKELQKRIKMFCIDHEGVDMKDVFMRGAELYMDGFEHSDL